MTLYHVAEKYFIHEVRVACAESLLEDIDVDNVLQRLQFTYLYQLSDLKISCKQYLVKFGKINDMQDAFNAFLGNADHDLVVEVSREVLGAL